MDKLLLQITNKLIDLIFDAISDPSEISDLSDKEIKYKKNKVKIITLCALLLVSIGSILFFGFYKFKPNDSDTTKNSEISYQTEINFSWIEEVNNSYFDLVKLDGNYELIDNNVGLYYFVDFLISENNIKKKIFYFDKGEYTVDRFQLEKLNFSIREFKKFIAKNSDNQVKDYKIFIKGKADKLTFSDPKKMKYPYIYDRVQYIGQSKNSGYNLNTIKSHYFTNYSYRNIDLPFLRAKFIEKQLQLNAIELLSPTSILKGEITREVSEFDRNVEVILYLPPIKDEIE